MSVTPDNVNNLSTQKVFLQSKQFVGQINSMRYINIGIENYFEYKRKPIKKPNQLNVVRRFTLLTCIQIKCENNVYNNRIWKSEIKLLTQQRKILKWP